MKTNNPQWVLTALFLSGSFISAIALAAETPLGKAYQFDYMEVGAVYLQAVTMEPNQKNMVSNPDIHLELDIHALKGNTNGFGVGEWIPYLSVDYTLTKINSSWKQEGKLIPMVANDGPHYGLNVKLDGPGQYHVRFHINPPIGSTKNPNILYRHTDKETGVDPWFSSFDKEWDFTYLGTGKKGGY